MNTIQQNNINVTITLVPNELHLVSNIWCSKCLKAMIPVYCYKTLVRLIQ